MPKTLKSKLSLVYVGLVCLMAAISMVSIVNLLFLQWSVSGLISQNYDSISAMNNAQNALGQQNVAILQYLELGDTEALSRYHTEEQIIDQAVWKEKSIITEPGENALSAQLEEDFQTWRGNFSVFQNMRDVKGTAEAAAYYQNELQPLSEKLRQTIGRIAVLNQTAMLQKKSVTAAHARDSLVLVILLSVLAVAGGFILSHWLLGRFLSPLRLLTDTISKLRVGDLDAQVDIRTGDEMESLAHEFNGMIGRLSAFEESTMGTLMEEKNRSVAIVKSISDPLLVLDEDFRILMANSACEAFFGFSEAQMLGRHFLEAVRDGALFDFILESFAQNNAVSRKVWQFTREKDYYFNLILTRGQGEGPAARGCVLLMQNVTDFKELERVKTDFVATVSHEFKTPLTSILMGASMLEGGHLGALSQEQTALVDTIIEDGERLSGFVNELLEVSRLESGKAIYSFEPCSISAIAEGSVRQYTEAAQRQNVTLENDIDEDLPPVCADYERITWVLNNLVGNALKYTKSGDSITLGAAVKGNEMEVSVKDTGDGIPSAYLDRIFDKFVQVKGRDIEARGTGLGLAVAKEIVTAHQGEISVESELDAGSTFRFTLPLAGRSREEEK